MCEGLLERYEAEGFMDRIVTMDETWVYFYYPLSKKAARAWKHHDSPRVMEAARVLKTLTQSREDYQPNTQPGKTKFGDGH